MQPALSFTETLAGEPRFYWAGAMLAPDSRLTFMCFREAQSTVLTFQTPWPKTLSPPIWVWESMRPSRKL